LEDGIGLCYLFYQEELLVCKESEFEPHVWGYWCWWNDWLLL